MQEKLSKGVAIITECRVGHTFVHIPYIFTLCPSVNAIIKSLSTARDCVLENHPQKGEAKREWKHKANMTWKI